MRWAGGARGRPLVVTRDVELLDELLLLADAGGVELTVAADGLAAADGWACAPLVVVGGDRVDELTRRALTPRLGVVLVAGSKQADDAMLWGEAGALHAEHVVVLPDAREWLVARFAEHGLRGARPRGHRAATIAVAGGSAAAGAGDLSLELALTARTQGLATLLVRAPGPAPEPGIDPVTRLTDSAAPGSLAVVSLDRTTESGVGPQVMAATLRAGQQGRDIVIVDLPGTVDDASLLAFTAADRGCLVVAAEVRDCAAANRLAATARRHCPALTLVVRASGPRGLRPVEVAEALDLPLLGVLPPEPPLARVLRPDRAAAGVEVAPLTRLCRRMINELRGGRRTGRERRGLAGGVAP